MKKMSLDYIKGLSNWEVCPLEEDNLYYVGEKYLSHFYYEGEGEVKSLVINRQGDRNNCGKYGTFERNIQTVVVGVFNDNGEIMKAFVHEASESLCCGEYRQIMNDYQIKYWVVD